MRVPDRRGSVWPLLAAVLGVVIAVALGNWQLSRALEKRDFKERLEAQAAQSAINVSGPELIAKDVELRRVEARGVFDPRYVVYIDNRIHRGVAGYHVIMPVRIEGTDRHVLVNRGWIARTGDRAQLPEVRTPGGVLDLSGIATLPGKRILELSGAVMEGRIWQNLTIERYREVQPIAIQSFVIRQESALDDGLVREWDPPDFGIDKHYGYAFQWFALAATILVLYAITQYRRRRTPPA